MADENITSYVVSAGDTLNKIVTNYSKYISGSTISEKINTLCTINHIPDQKYIVIGQIIYFTEEAAIAAGATYPQEKSVTITSFGYYAGNTGTIYASWEWNNPDTNYFEIVWKIYSDKTGEWVEGEQNQVLYTSNKIAYKTKYNYPIDDDKPSQVRLDITPISKTKEVNNQETAIFTAETVTRIIDIAGSEPPPKPMVEPTYSLEPVNKVYTLTVTLENVEIGNATRIKFKLLEQKEGSSEYIEKESKEVGLIYIKTTVKFDNLAVGSIYKIQYQGVVNNTYGEWSDPSSSIAPPPTTPIIETIKAIYKKPEESLSQNGIDITWLTCKSAKQYEFQFLALPNATENPEYWFNQTDYEGKIPPVTIEQENVITYIENGVEKANFTFYNVASNLVGKYCYVRCKSSNSSSSGGIISSITGGKNSKWSDIVNFEYGTNPGFPTTWHSQSSVFPGDELKIYFVHNSADNSVLSSAKIKFYFSNGEEYEHTYGNSVEGTIIKKIYKNNPKNVNDNVYVIEIDTTNSKFSEGETLGYQVCTSGIYSSDGSPAYGEYSPKKEIKIYTIPIFTMTLLDNEDNVLNDDELSSSIQNPEDGSEYEIVKVLESFPLKVKLELTNMNNQNPVSYHLSIVADSDKSGYETVDNIGNKKIVSKGSIIYSKYLDTNSINILEEISANDVSLKDGERYAINCIAFLSSGLTTKVSKKFTVRWVTKTQTPFAEIAFYKDNLIAHIRPYTESSDENIMLTVFRREFDGSFVQIGTEIQNGGSDYVVDPHPALNYARYRIVAKSKTTGAIEYNDTPILSMGEYSIVLQWDETWSNFSATEGQVLSNSPWSGSMLKLPYNISISSSHSPDVSAVEYIGRKHPVSYYGTQTGETESWSVDIPKNDIETLYAIRRLSVWMGDVYVREPSGSGYWANVMVNYSQKSRDLVIPVTFKITRVEGGI